MSSFINTHYWEKNISKKRKISQPKWSSLWGFHIVKFKVLWTYGKQKIKTALWEGETLESGVINFSVRPAVLFAAGNNKQSPKQAKDTAL